VLSYRTPIAWVTTDGKVHFPARRYSLTTTQHQGVVRQAFNDRREDIERYGPEVRAVSPNNYGQREGW
jgi:hypothetical protein